MTAGFVDIHNHTLPAVDDGAGSIEDSLAMASIAAEDGIETVVLTPHSKDVAESLGSGTFQESVRQLQEAVTAAGVPVRFLVGLENHLEPDLTDKLDTGLALTMNGSSYILVELPFSPILPIFTDYVLSSLRLRGLTPIIAHPERCDALVGDPELLAGMVRLGSLAQVTSTSLTGRFGPEYRKAAETFLERGLVHVIASDGHSHRGPRVPVISDGVEAAARIVGDERALGMAIAVPRAIVEGRPVESELPPTQSAKSRRFWRR
jgi:protein-tyrosine phosphatase